MFTKFDPLKIAPQEQDESAHTQRVKRAIHSILHSYVSWYDPFCELLQNALDSVDKRAASESENGYQKKISIVVDYEGNRLTVSDNGTGLGEVAFQKFLAPNESFKSGQDNERGSKGVGATYLAYGFNYIRISTKSDVFVASGVMKDARNWLHDKNPSENPQVHPDDGPEVDQRFEGYDKGVSITVGFDKQSKPKDLSWPSIKSADTWIKVLRVKTALGAIASDDAVSVELSLKDGLGSITTAAIKGVGYAMPHDELGKTMSYEDTISILDEAVRKRGASFQIPTKTRNLEAVFVNWENAEILENLPKLSGATKELLKSHPATLRATYAYTANIWDHLAKNLNYRKTAGVYGPGLQLATDNMPQGELIQIPLNRYTGRQNQVHVLLHFKDCVVDLGRKGFSKEVVDAAKDIAVQLVQDPLSKVRDCLKSDDVKRNSLLAGDKVSDWKKGLEEKEKESPLLLQNENFFLPINEISVTSEPSREQDVIALFNQLVAGGVIRGIKIVGTHESMTYDGAYRVRMGPDFEAHRYNEETNPLGVEDPVVNEIAAARVRMH